MNNYLKNDFIVFEIELLPEHRVLELELELKLEL